MKKLVIYVIAILLVVIVTVSGTYAYFVATISSNSNSVLTNSSKLEVIYTGDTSIKTENASEKGYGILNLVNSKEEGYILNPTIKLSNDSVDAEADVYILVNEIGQNLATEAFNWEVYRTFNNNQTFISSGTFAGAQAEDKIYVDREYRLSTEETVYNIYIWLDGNKIGNEALGESFDFDIEFEVMHITELK